MDQAGPFKSVINYSFDSWPLNMDASWLRKLCNYRILRHLTNQESQTQQC